MMALQAGGAVVAEDDLLVLAAELEDVDAGAGYSRHGWCPFLVVCGRGVVRPGRDGRGVVTAVTSRRSAERPDRIAGPHHDEVAVGAVAEQRARPYGAPLKATISHPSSTRASVGHGRLVGYGASSAPPRSGRRSNTGKPGALAASAVPPVAGEDPPARRRPRRSVVPSVAVRSLGGAAAARGRRASARRRAAGWKRKNRRALTKPTSHAPSSRTRWGSHTPTESQPVGRAAAARGCRARARPCSRSSAPTRRG